MRSRILYCFGGCGNFGDDYILDQWIEFYRQHDPDLKIIVARRDLWLEDFYRDIATFSLQPIFAEIYLSNVMGHLKEGVDYIRAAMLAGKTSAAAILDPAKGISDLLKGVEAIHFCGGGYWNRIFKDVWGMASMLSEIAVALNVPLYGTGLGLTPPLVGRPLADKIINRFNFIETRDQESYDDFSARYPRLNLAYGLDDTFLTPVKFQMQERQPRIYFCVQSDLREDVNHPRILEKCLQLVAHFGKEYDIGYLKFHDEPDSVFLEKLRASLNRSISIYDKNSLLRHGLPITDQDICVTTRFHLHLLAARLGARGGYVWTGDEYYRIKHKSLTDIGSEWVDFLSPDTQVSSIGRLPEPRIGGGDFVRRKTKLMFETVLKETPAAHLYI